MANPGISEDVRARMEAAKAHNYQQVAYIDPWAEATKKLRKGEISHYDLTGTPHVSSIAMVLNRTGDFKGVKLIPHGEGLRMILTKPQLFKLLIKRIFGK